MFIHDYILACEISTVRTLTLRRPQHKLTLQPISATGSIASASVPFTMTGAGAIGHASAPQFASMAAIISSVALLVIFDATIGGAVSCNTSDVTPHPDEIPVHMLFEYQPRLTTEL